mmetsp:Transcript_95316/g.296775  ORF Transcript_95316/g.296775 Transcript_95316/m.296775 type:complete len:282 (+) Transcript_95316:38-883(+)
MQSGYEGAFMGQWEDATGKVISITDSIIRGPDGGERKFAAEKADTCTFKRGDNVYEGKLSEDGNTLSWPGGVVWVRRVGAMRRDAHAAHAAEAALRPSLTLEQALHIQDALYKGFSDSHFQRRLQEIERHHAGNQDLFLAERSRLLLTVQAPILSEYGFESSQKGVIDMLDAGARFNCNSEYVQNRERLNHLLGMVDLNCGRHIVVRHFLDAGEVKVELPRSATFLDLKRALSRIAGTDDIVQKGLLVRSEENGALFRYKDVDPVLSTQEVFLFKADLPSN